MFFSIYVQEEKRQQWHPYLSFAAFCVDNIHFSIRQPLSRGDVLYLGMSVRIIQLAAPTFFFPQQVKKLKAFIDFLLPLFF